MKKGLILCMLSTFILSLMVFMSACQLIPTTEPSPAPGPAEPTPTPEPGEPSSITEPGNGMVPEKVPIVEEMELIKEWEGTGKETTEPFTIESAPWVISWENNPPDGGSFGMLTIVVLDADGKPLEMTVMSTEKEADVTYIYETGTFHLSMDTLNTTWKVQVLK